MGTEAEPEGVGAFRRFSSGFGGSFDGHAGPHKLASTCWPTHAGPHMLAHARWPHILAPHTGPTCWPHMLAPHAGHTCWPHMLATKVMKTRGARAPACRVHTLQKARRKPLETKGRPRRAFCRLRRSRQGSPAARMNAVKIVSATLCSQECEHGTHECVRYGSLHLPAPISSLSRLPW